MPRQGLLALSAVVLAALLAGCQGTASTELDAGLSAIGGVESVDVDTTRVKATLVDDISAADAEAAIIALRDQAVAGHPLGAGVELVVVMYAGPRDFGDAQPWEVYGYGKWSAGAVGGDAFGQQATFLASLADWETLTTSVAQIRQVRFEVSGLTTVAETPAAGETPAAEDPAADPAAATTQVVALKLRWTLPPAAADPAAEPAADPAGDPADEAQAAIDAAMLELEDLWVASGGTADAITIG